MLIFLLHIAIHSVILGYARQEPLLTSYLAYSKWPALFLTLSECWLSFC